MDAIDHRFPLRWNFLLWGGDYTKTTRVGECTARSNLIAIFIVSVYHRSSGGFYVESIVVRVERDSDAPPAFGKVPVVVI